MMQILFTCEICNHTWDAGDRYLMYEDLKDDDRQLCPECGGHGDRSTGDSGEMLKYECDVCGCRWTAQEYQADCAICPTCEEEGNVVDADVAGEDKHWEREGWQDGC